MSQLDELFHQATSSPAEQPFDKEAWVQKNRNCGNGRMKQLTR